MFLTFQKSLNMCFSDTAINFVKWQFMASFNVKKDSCPTCVIWIQC